MGRKEVHRVLTYGGKARLGLRSKRISPALGGGIRYAGGHASILCGVFHGTVGWSDCVDAYRAIKAVWRRHCNCLCGGVRSKAAESRRDGIVWARYVCCCLDDGFSRSVDARRRRPEVCSVWLSSFTSKESRLQCQLLSYHAAGDKHFLRSYGVIL